jgi:hypothetical protein
MKAMVASALLLAAGAAAAAPLGAIHFPVAAKGAAAEHFQRGVLALHSFWYDEAADEFRAATAADPRFALGYWGEAMTANHPIWGEQDTAAGARALAKIPADAPLRPRDRGLVEAARLLFGAGDKAARDAAYAAAMDRLHRELPDDDEVAAFDALALLGAAAGRDVGARMRAGALALDVLARNPEHPGAAHYIIHAFDDPEHAVLALPAARRYARIAPEANHALHMPSHIFVQLGLWPEARAANEAAFAASRAWVARKHLPDAKSDFHSLSWLAFILLQEGKRARAEAAVAQMRQLVARADTEPARLAYTRVVTALLVETEEWGRADELLLPAAPETSIASAAGALACGAHTARVAPPFEAMRHAEEAYVRGRAAVARGAVDDAAGRARALAQIARELAGYEDGQLGKGIAAAGLELEARAAARRGAVEDALASLRRAAAFEAEVVASGPSFEPPIHEVAGELLFAAHRADEAAAEFAAALKRCANRPRSLRGLARAARGATAADARSRLAAAWREADPGWPGLADAR